MHGVTVSYLTGTGGHFLGNIIHNMLYGTPVHIYDDGSCHGTYYHNFYYEILLEKDASSWSAFEQRMQAPSSPVFMMHCMNLDLLSRYSTKVIYISFAKSELPVIAKRFVTKTIDKLTKDMYSNIAGVDWPDYATFIRDKPDHIMEEVTNFRTHKFDQWEWIYPADSSMLFDVPFSELETGSYLNMLAEFLNVSSFDLTYLMRKTEEYSSKQSVPLDKYEYGNTERTQARGI